MAITVGKKIMNITVGKNEAVVELINVEKKEILSCSGYNCWK